jgi:hypothetical protein
VKPLHALPAVVLLALTAACGAHHASGAADHSTSSTHSASTTVVSHGQIVVLSDPGHVTYSMHPSGCHASGTSPATYRPDPRCTPGGIDPKVTQANIHSTICRSGYTATVRPPVSETSRAKRAQYAAYGIASGDRSELDHLVSLELGGDNDVANLWPEVGPLPNPKDRVENDLHRAVCSGRVKLADAQNAIATNWTTAEHALGIG